MILKPIQCLKKLRRHCKLPLILTLPCKRCLCFIIFDLSLKRLPQTSQTYGLELAKKGNLVNLQLKTRTITMSEWRNLFTCVSYIHIAPFGISSLLTKSPHLHVKFSASIVGDLFSSCRYFSMLPLERVKGPDDE
uniref:Uncharacterized protein n=1 Tax=Romanomermis culicivorax TaxID=13658 RepID=A0A915IZG3_ROMCU